MNTALQTPQKKQDLKKKSKKTLINQTQLYQHVNLLHDLSRPVTIQGLPESPDCDLEPVIWHRKVNRALNGLEAYSEAGGGLFISVNPTDGKGRRKENITAIKCLVLDFDTEQINDFIVIPSFTVKTKRGIHAYFVFSVEQKLNTIWGRLYPKIQRILAKYYGADQGALNLNQVMRLAGTLHQKGEPVMTEMEAISGPKYSISELVAAHYPYIEELQELVNEYGLIVGTKLCKLSHYTLLRSHMDTLPLQTGARHIKVREYIQDAIAKSNIGCFSMEECKAMCFEILAKYQEMADTNPDNKFPFSEIEALWNWCEIKNKKEPFTTTFVSRTMLIRPSKVQNIQTSLKSALSLYSRDLHAYRTGSSMSAKRSFVNFLPVVVIHAFEEFGFYCHSMIYSLGLIAGMDDRFGFGLGLEIPPELGQINKADYFKGLKGLLGELGLVQRSVYLGEGRPLSIFVPADRADEGLQIAEDYFQAFKTQRVFAEPQPVAPEALLKNPFEDEREFDPEAEENYRLFEWLVEFYQSGLYVDLPTPFTVSDRLTVLNHCRFIEALFYNFELDAWFDITLGHLRGYREALVLAVNL